MTTTMAVFVGGPLDGQNLTLPGRPKEHRISVRSEATFRPLASLPVPQGGEPMRSHDPIRTGVYADSGDHDSEGRQVYRWLGFR